MEVLIPESDPEAGLLASQSRLMSYQAKRMDLGAFKQVMSHKWSLKDPEDEIRQIFVAMDKGCISTFLFLFSLSREALDLSHFRI